MPDSSKIIYTIGHSTRSVEEFLNILHSFAIRVLVDIRSFPGSRRYPQFNKEYLEENLPTENISYMHLPLLGGRRKTNADSKNLAWKNESFRGYADYMETKDFKKGLQELKEIAKDKTTAFMCSEAVWWRCHRSLVSDYLKCEGWKVMHINGVSKSTEHPYTSPAKIANNTLSYMGNNPGLF